MAREKKRYVVTMDMYVYAENDYMARKNAHKLADNLRNLRDNQAAVLDIVEQPFGTRTENVNPFMISFWVGSIELTPASDNWVDTVRLEANVSQVEGNFAETLERATTTFLDKRKFSHKKQKIHRF